MFTNLIESSSHAREFKRRGSFIIFTGAVYFVLFIAAGVVSIYAYDARLEQPDDLIVTMLSPTDFPATPTPAHNPTPPRSTNSGGNIAIRQIAIASVNDPHSMPDRPSAVASKNPPIPTGVPWKIGSTNYDPPVAGGTSHGGNGGGSGPTGPVAIDAGAPPPAQVPVHKTPPPVQSKGVIMSLAISLPKPVYPVLAKQAHVQGIVTVQVLVDESGRVMSAKAVAGHPLLLVAAQQAAMQAKFSPTKLGDQPVKVSGVITYNFVLQ